MRADDGRAIVKIAAPRVLTTRGGLFAFDVEVRKTCTALAILARARREDFGRRPEIVVPRLMVEGSQRDGEN